MKSDITVLSWNQNSVSVLLSDELDCRHADSDDIARFRGKTALSPLEQAYVILQRQSEFNRQ